VEEGRLRDFYKRAGQAHYVDELVMGLLLDTEAAPSAP